ncbi:beta-galactosidase family protein [Granulicella sp. dw_53]|uniref:glycoside hydrolase family 35 protein n=1 Tax=Granulicella sp. dw_53 TaxID=2719792 RepID=UPI001BD585AA|nr:beta-galactosidase family protein [Granulicella sp. dw_53]
MTRTILLPSALALASLLGAATSASSQPPKPTQTFTIQQDHFLLNGQPFKILSGELHYARIPREYWHARLKMAKAMGLNTIATYVFWNIHEPTPGHFDFTGNNDLAAFIKAAQQEGLYVILRSGPYSCAEWEFGGFPAWLLKDPAMEQTLRSNDPSFMVPTERWIHRLAQEVAPLQIGHGGPIIMTQVENEYGNFDHDHAYMEHLKTIFEQSGLTASLLYSADNWRNIPAGSIPGLYAATNFGIGNHQGGMDALAKVRPDAPLFVSEYWPGWFDHWGHPHETRPVAPQLEDLDYILHRGAGINIYMFHGGTSFGFMAGSSNISGQFLPDVTSYDYDAPLDEAGHPTPKLLAYRKILATFSPCGNESCLPPVPTAPPVITIPPITLTESTSLWQNLPTAIASETPQSMEHFDQSYGYILYRTQLPAATSGDLVLTDLHDYAQIYLDGKLTGTLDRRNKQSTLPIKTDGPARLDILVANDGRINSTKQMRIESKGITKSVTLSGTPLTGWQIYPLPMTTLPTHFNPAAKQSQAPTLRRGSFTLASTGDTFLDIRTLGKGALWINGHPIGRFWNVGPQQTLFVPGPWLRKGRNEVVVFDLLPSTTPPHLAGLAQPILDGPATDQTKSKQE